MQDSVKPFKSKTMHKLSTTSSKHFLLASSCKYVNFVKDTLVKRKRKLHLEKKLKGFNNKKIKDQIMKYNDYQF